MSKSMYVLGEGGVVDFLSQYGLITRINEKGELEIINAFPKLRPKATKIVEVNNNLPQFLSSWHAGKNYVNSGDGRVYVIDPPFVKLS